MNQTGNQVPPPPAGSPILLVSRKGKTEISGQSQGVPVGLFSAEELATMKNVSEGAKWRFWIWKCTSCLGLFSYAFEQDRGRLQ